MARKPPPEHTRFKPGQSGNPGGKLKVNPRFKNSERFTDNELKAVISKCFCMDKKQLIEAGNSEKLTGIELVIVRTLLTAANKGDYTRVAPLVERLCGRVQYTIGQVADEILDAKPQVVINLPAKDVTP